MRRWLLWAPLAIFALLALAMIYGLRQDDQRTVASRMVGQPLPAFALAPALPGRPGLVRADMPPGKPYLLNLFASWCVPCIAEAPQLMAIRQAGVPIMGVAIRDTPEALAGFLDKNGDPYDRIGGDPESQVAIALGSSGVPETYLIDGKGVIRYQKIGDIRADDVAAIVASYRAAM